VLEVQGNADATVPYGGGPIYTGGPPAPGAVETVGDWAKLNHCTGALAATGQTLELDSAVVGAETQVSAYAGCPTGAVELWTINGGSHIPALRTTPGTIPTWGELVYGWLSAHPKP
jgi:poly(3-hydroxybutyrate) depolymerase